MLGSGCPLLVPLHENRLGFGVVLCWVGLLGCLLDWFGLRLSLGLVTSSFTPQICHVFLLLARRLLAPKDHRNWFSIVVWAVWVPENHRVYIHCLYLLLWIWGFTKGFTLVYSDCFPRRLGLTALFAASAFGVDRLSTEGVPGPMGPLGCWEILLQIFWDQRKTIWGSSLFTFIHHVWFQRRFLWYVVSWCFMFFFSTTLKLFR